MSGFLDGWQNSLWRSANLLTLQPPSTFQTKYCSSLICCHERHLVLIMCGKSTHSNLVLYLRIWCCNLYLFSRVPEGNIVLYLVSLSTSVSNNFGGSSFLFLWWLVKISISCMHAFMQYIKGLCDYIRLCHLLLKASAKSVRGFSKVGLTLNCDHSWSV